MRLRTLATITLVASIFAPRPASADSLPDSEKGVSQSFRVEGDAPAGKRIVLANTFEGADVMKLDETASVQWHPSGGDMFLAAVDDGDAGRIAELRKDRNREAIAKIVASGVKCSDPIVGLRSTRTSEPWDEIRRTYKVSFEGGRCSAKLTVAEYLDKSGKGVKPFSDPLAGLTPPSSTATSTSSAAAPASPAAKSGCGCEMIGSLDSTSPGRLPLATALLGASFFLFARRQKRSK